MNPVFAYIGPGAGLSAIGSLLALVAAVIVGVLGFLWFPVKRLLRNRKTVSVQLPESTPAAETEGADQTAFKESQGRVGEESQSRVVELPEFQPAAETQDADR